MTVQKIKSGRVLSPGVEDFIGNKGQLFYDENIGEIRISDGITPGGIPVTRSPDSVGFGYTGSAGYVGSTGYIGSIGYVGSTGYTGSTGYVGSTGYTGSTGYVGSIGIIGYTGSAGFGLTAEGNAELTTDLVFASTSSTITLGGRSSERIPNFYTGGTPPENTYFWPGDKWYDSINDVIYEYRSYDSGYAWFDITGPYFSTAVSSANRTATLYQDGNLTPTTGTVRWYNPTDITITKITARLAEAADDTVTINVKKSSTITNVISISTGSIKTISLTSIDMTTDDYLTVDIVETGNIDTGSGLSIEFTYNLK